jgi:hypothetical protein
VTIDQTLQYGIDICLTYFLSEKGFFTNIFNCQDSSLKIYTRSQSYLSLLPPPLFFFSFFFRETCHFMSTKCSQLPFIFNIGYHLFYNYSYHSFYNDSYHSFYNISYHSCFSSSKTLLLKFHDRKRFLSEIL